MLPDSQPGATEPAACCPTTCADSSAESNGCLPRRWFALLLLAPQYRPGTALLYRMDTFHRGTPVKPGATRITGHYVVKRAAAEWMGSNSFVAACAAMPPSFVAGLTLQQRRALAMPDPGHPYWTHETIAAVCRRYTGMDAGPYLDALGESKL